MRTTTSASYRVAPPVLLLGALLAASNWYLQPERAWAWTAALLLIGCCALVVALAFFASKGQAAWRQAAGSIMTAVSFAGLIMACALGAKLIGLLGGFDTREFSQRATMVILGALFVFTGNMLPKRLTPLAALPCDESKAQAAQRHAGWTWVLTGLAFVSIWLWTPVNLAEPLSMSVLVVGTLVSVTQPVRACWTRRTAMR